MTRTPRLTSGSWFRYETYILDNAHILPTTSTALEEYDPWGEYEEHVWNRELVDERPPHLTLLEIGARARELGAQAYLAPPEDFAKDVCAWCSKWGLLGLLPHQVDRVELSFRGDAQKHLSKMAKRTVHVRTDLGWNTQELLVLPDETGIADTKIHLRRLETGWSDIETIRGAMQSDREPEWGLYFPGIPLSKRSTYKYPVPLSREFWKIYGEPLERFVRVTRDLLGIVESMSSRSDVFPPGREQAPNINDYQFNAIRRELQLLVTTVRPTLETDERGKIQFRWVSSSLLGSLALMCLLDLTNTKIFRCQKPGCGKFFRSNRSKTKYCSPACKAAAKQRRLRSRAAGERGKNGPKR